jgi:KDO2-lipid IV(A) lauroyltransferase
MVTCVHLGNWELIVPIGLKLGLQLSGIYLVPDNPFEHGIVIKVRRRAGLREAIPGHLLNTRRAVRALRQGPGLALFIDELTEGRVQAPAFGRPIKAEGNISYAVRLAQMTDAVIIPGYCRRLNDSAHFHYTFLPPIAFAQGGSKEEDLLANVAALNAAIEPVIRDNLDQWFYGLDYRPER